VGYDSFSFAEPSGFRIAYHETGSGQPLIILHGAESHKGQYEIFAPLLSPDVRVISYDQRDVGDAVSPDEDYSIKDLADDCVRLMDALDIPTAHVMGISLGGVIALNVAMRHPERVHTLIVGAAPDLSHPNEFLRSLVDASPSERESMMLDASMSPAGQKDEWLLTHLASLDRDPVTGQGSRRQAAMTTGDAFAELERIEAPTLILYGDSDPIAPAEVGHRLNREVPNSEMIVLEGARHGLSFEFRRETARAVNEWIARHPLTST
jgi:3-oxoadipate enol-lactonase